jgi:large subunit ribosomal protein L29
MPLPKIKEIRELSDTDLSVEILKVKKDLFTLRMNKATRQPFKPHEFGLAKNRLGQLMTVEHERLQIKIVAIASEVIEPVTAETGLDPDQNPVQAGAE